MPFFFKIFKKIFFLFIIICFFSCKIVNHTISNKNYFSFIIDKKYPSISFSKKIYYLIIHYTALNFQDSLKALTKHKVSSHYLIPETLIDGNKKIFCLVNENLKSWHAGISYWEEKKN